MTVDEAIICLSDMKIKVAIPKAAVQARLNNDALNMAIEALRCSEIPNNWIPCSERLPQQGQEVICQCRANIIKVLKLDANGDWYQDAEHCYMGGFVIAWMPLPEPYKGEQE